MAVTYEDVAVSLGRPITTPEQIAQVSLWIADAQRIIRNRLGDLALLDQDDLDYVVREAVVLKVKNPDAVRRTDVAVDDGRIGKEYSTSTGLVSILPEWWEMLTPHRDSEAFSTRPGFEPDALPAESWI